jgi:type IX secretion system PorP/SprF family membrane protein
MAGIFKKKYAKSSKHFTAMLLFGLKNKRAMKRPILFGILLFCSIEIWAQDLHFSQISLAPLHQNPALAGVFKGDIRAGGSLRSQWKSVPVPYQTTTVFADSKLLDLGSWVVGGGILFDADKAGDAGISWTKGSLFGSFSRVLNEKSAISLGIAVGGGQRTFDINNLKWGKQFVDGSFTSAAGTGETFNRSSKFIPDLGAGINYHFQQNKDSRSTFDVGLGSFHLNRPTVNFRDEKASFLGVRWNIHANTTLQLGSTADILCFANVQRQSEYREGLLSFGIRRWLKRDATAVSYLLGYRFGDAVIPQVRLEWQNWLVGFSYDWNTSGLNVATFGKGGPELAVQWRFLKVPPVKTFKVCPIY